MCASSCSLLPGPGVAPQRSFRWALSALESPFGAFSPLPVCPVIPSRGTVRFLSEVNRSTCVVTITPPGPCRPFPAFAH